MINFTDVKAFISNATQQELQELLFSVHAERNEREKAKKNQLKQTFFDAWKALADAGYNVCWDADYNLEYGDSFNWEDITID